MFKAGLLAIFSDSISEYFLIELDGSADAVVEAEVVAILFDYLLAALSKHSIILYKGIKKWSISSNTNLKCFIIILIDIQAF